MMPKNFSDGEALRQAQGHSTGPRPKAEDHERAPKGRFEWWFRPCASESLGLFRIGVGILLLILWVWRVRWIPAMFSSSGILFPQVPAWLPSFFGIAPSIPVAWFLYLVFLLCLFLVTVGLFTRAAAITALILYFHYYMLALAVFDTAFERVSIFMLFIAAWGDSGAAFSLDAWRKRGSVFASIPLKSILPLRICALQLSAVYLGSGLEKLWLPWWQGGNMLWYTFLGDWGTPLALSIAAAWGWSSAYHVVINLVKFLEVALPFGLWASSRPFKIFSMVCGAFFHLMNALLLGLWQFFIFVPAYLFFFEPEEVAAWIKGRAAVASARSMGGK